MPQAPETWLAVVYLCVIGSIGLFGLLLAMLRRWTASASSYAILAMPLVAIALGAVVRGETITPIFLLGGALVAFGVYVGALSGPAAPGSRGSDPPTHHRDR